MHITFSMEYMICIQLVCNTVYEKITRELMSHGQCRYNFKNNFDLYFLKSTDVKPQMQNSQVQNHDCATITLF